MSMRNGRVITRSGIARTTSVAIAEDFGKAHQDVVKGLLALECSEKFFAHHFHEVSTTTTGHGIRMRSPVYAITLEGFLLLTANYHGRAAVTMREIYVDAFRQARVDLSPVLQPAALVLKQLAFYRNVIVPQLEGPRHQSGAWSFDFEASQIRTVLNEGEVWFVVRDILQALDYAKSSNTSRMLAHVPIEWKGVNRIHTPSGGAQEMSVVCEQGLYFFLGRSDKPKALPFQKWLAGEVLPQLRRNGVYALPARAENDGFECGRKNGAIACDGNVLTKTN